MANNLNIEFLEEYAVQTGGQIFYSGQSIPFIEGTIADIFKSASFLANRGEYLNVINLGSKNIINQLSVNNIPLLPTGSVVEFRARYSNDNETWSGWTIWTDSSNPISLPESISNNYRYVQYQVKLIGNDLFESPIVKDGLEVCYYMAGNLVVFFNPVELDIDPDEYVSSVHITSGGVVPETSLVNYGFCQCDPLVPDLSDYYSEVRPLIESDYSSVILARSDEPMETEDFRTYKATNGRWASDLSIRLYRNGILVPSVQYVVDNSSGEITFYDEQPTVDVFKLYIDFDSVFRVTMNMVNYGTSSAVMENLAIMYNISTRVNNPS